MTDPFDVATGDPASPVVLHVPHALRAHFEPYAAAVRDLVADRLAATGRAVILDVHSYPTRPLPYERHGADPRPPVCLGADRCGDAPAALVRVISCRLSGGRPGA